MKADIILNNQQLFFRKKFVDFINKPFNSLTFYFNSANGIYCPLWCDYIEGPFNKESLETLKKILIKDKMTVDDLIQIIKIANLISSELVNDIATLKNSIELELKGFDINDLYFSID